MRKYSAKARKFYDSRAWKSCREYYIAKRVTIDGGLCEHCKDKLGYIVDHIKEINEINIDDPNITLNHDNLQYLCLDCHNTKTFSKAKRGVRFNSEGEPIFYDLRQGKGEDDATQG